jgi:tetratricopeptide (TPR) repeat protein
MVQVLTVGFMLNKINISHSKQRLIVYIVLTVVTLAVFWQVKHFEFVNIDDNIYVTENSHIKSGITLEGFRWAFSIKYFGWDPLTFISLILDYKLYGFNAGGYHVTNVILHILSSLLLFWLFNRMTGAIWKSAFVAAFFALHPLHVESVAWIAERKDVLSAFFWMLTLCLYVYYKERPVIKRYMLVLFCFILALMSKPVVVTLPVIMILLDYWPLSRYGIGIESRNDKLLLWQLKEKMPFIILSIIVIIINLYNLQNKSLITIDTTYRTSSEEFSLLSRIANAPVAFVTYLEKIFWPNDLAILYPFSDTFPFWRDLGAALLIIVISAAVIAVAKRLQYLFVGWLWYAITILPAIGIIQAGNEAMADRYTYLPSIGIGIMLAWGIPFLFSSEDIRKKILFPAGIAALAILAILTWQQCGYWKDSATLFSHTLQVTKDNHLAHNNFGLALFAEGKTEEAIDHYNQAIRLQPNYAIAYNSRGQIYGYLGQYQRAIEDLNKAIRLKPNYKDAYNNRGFAYGKLGQYQLAIENYDKAIRLQPNNAAVAYSNRGLTYGYLGQYQRAIEDFDKSIQLQPNAATYYNRGVAYFYQGNNELGCRDAQKACEFGICKLLDEVIVKGYCR